MMMWGLVSVSMHAKEQTGEEMIAFVCSTSQGFNYLKAQPVFVFLYLIFLYMKSPEVSAQYLIRRSRGQWYIRRLLQSGRVAIWFAGVYCMILLLYTTLYTGSTLVGLSEYRYAMLLFFVSVVWLHFFHGVLYQLFFILSLKGSISMIAAFLISIGIMAFSFYRFIPLVYLGLDILQLAITDMDTTFYPKVFLYNGPVCAILSFVGYRIVRKRDITGKKYD